MKAYGQQFADVTSDDDIYLLDKYFKENKVDVEKTYNKARDRLIKIVSEREEKTLKIVMYEYPMHTHRGRTDGRGGIYSPGAKEHKKYFEKQVKKVTKKAISIINTPMRITIDAYLEMPKAVPPDEVMLFQLKLLSVIDKPDWDNIGKCYPDMMTEILTVDDDIVYSGTVNRYYNLLPRVVITITYLAKHESKYIYKKMKNRKTVKQLLENNQIEFEFLE